MRMTRFFGLMALAIALLPTSYAEAAPVDAAPQTLPSLVIPVQADCHADVRRHFLPQLGRRVLHRHRVDCRVVIVERDDEDEDDFGRRDCHRDVQRHFLPEFGRRVTHRHVGPNCRVRVYEERRRDDDDGGRGAYCEQ